MNESFDFDFSEEQSPKSDVSEHELTRRTWENVLRRCVRITNTPKAMPITHDLKDIVSPDEPIIGKQAYLDYPIDASMKLCGEIYAGVETSIAATYDDEDVLCAANLTIMRQDAASKRIRDATGTASLLDLSLSMRFHLTNTGKIIVMVADPPVDESYPDEADHLATLWDEYESWGFPPLASQEVISPNEHSTSLDENHAQVLLAKLNGITEEKIVDEP